MCHCNCNGQRDLYIGSDFGGINLFNEDGTAIASAPYVTLHDIPHSEYYVATSVTRNADNKTFDVVFNKNITKKMHPDTVLALEIYADSTMALMIKYDRAFARTIVVSPTPGQSVIS